MPRGQLPKAYLRIDPDLDAKHPDLLAEFIRLLCAANRQPRRGVFKTRAVIEGLLGKAVTRRLIARGDVVEEGTEWIVDGWERWQEGNLDVAERMRRIRAGRDNKPRTNPAHSAHIPRTDSAQMVAPTSEASGNKASITPEPPNPHAADNIEVLADGLLLHPATPGQLRAIRTLSRKVGEARTLEVMQAWMTREVDDRFGGALDELGAEAKKRRERKESEWAYMDEPA